MRTDWTPLHTRLIAHRVGDGTVNSYGVPVYDNKNMDSFIELTNHLKIKTWKPVISDKYGTKKICIPVDVFKKFSIICKCDYRALINEPVFLLDNIMKLGSEHRLEALLAAIVDDGSCKRWSICIFEDQNKATVDKINDLWDSLFPTKLKSSIIITKRGTKVFHLFCNREGIIRLYESIQRITKKYGYLASLWWKQKDLESRYLKATSERARQINETFKKRDNWNKKILEHIKDRGFITNNATMKLLGLSKYRTLRVLSKLAKNEKLILIKAGNRSRYVLVREDISLENREKLILDYLNENKYIQNKNARKILDLKESQTLKILNSMVESRLVKRINIRGLKAYAPF